MAGFMVETSKEDFFLETSGYAFDALRGVVMRRGDSMELEFKHAAWPEHWKNPPSRYVIVCNFLDGKKRVSNGFDVFVAASEAFITMMVKRIEEDDVNDIDATLREFNDNEREQFLNYNERTLQVKITRWIEKLLR